jgi:hypothetical protein
VLIDKATFPRDKICGDGISNQCVHVIQKWLDPSVMTRFAAANHLQIDSWGLQVEGTKGNGFEIPYRPYSDKTKEMWGSVGRKSGRMSPKKRFFGSNTEGYDERIYRMRGQEFKVSYWLQRQFRRAWFFNTLVALISKNQHLARTFAFVFTDINLKQQLRKPAFWWGVLTNKKDKLMMNYK